ncbi:hypothetical protein [Streptomyces sp. NPDC003456]|uniref:hypothetical protein n=1 Tax=Streptomyces sp. NPDC003456 TaxID=3364683 RepID=UPI00368FE934
MSCPLLLQDPEAVYGGGWHDQLTRVAGRTEEGGVRLLREESGLVVAPGAGHGGGRYRRSAEDLAALLVGLSTTAPAVGGPRHHRPDGGRRGDGRA